MKEETKGYTIQTYGRCGCVVQSEFVRLEDFTNIDDEQTAVSQTFGEFKARQQTALTVKKVRCQCRRYL